MKINPYLYFGGNAAEAIAFYEKAFGCTAKILKYKDVAMFDSTYQIAPGTENLVMHANMIFGDSVVMVCDVTPDIAHGFSAGVQLMINMDSEAEARKAFDAMKEGGEVTMDLQKTFWSDCFGSLKDKFGVHWLFDFTSAK